MTTHPATLPRPVNHHHTLAMAIVGATLSVGIVVTFAAVKVWSDDSADNATTRFAGPVVSPETAYDLELATMAAANANRFDPVVEPPGSVPVSPERTSPASREGVRGLLDTDTSDFDVANAALFGSREPNYPASREGVRGLVDSDTSDFDVAKVEVGGALPDTMAAEEWNRIRDSLGLGSDLVP